MRPFHSTSPKRRSRVVPGVSSTMARRSPTRRLNKVLFPTLGLPTSATIGLGILVSDWRFMILDHDCRINNYDLHPAARNPYLALRLRAKTTALRSARITVLA